MCFSVLQGGPMGPGPVGPGLQGPTHQGPGPQAPQAYDQFGQFGQPTYI